MFLGLNNNLPENQNFIEDVNNVCFNIMVNLYDRLGGISVRDRMIIRLT